MSKIVDTQAAGILAMSPRDASKAIGIGMTMLYAEIKAGRLKARKIGKRTVILRDDLLEYLNSLSQRAA
jgi:excisionase family DNA binding protein